ncbi:hypothetical protein Pla100_43890 [Neorhodopirellula pilleata]|uniref:Uncharacterized protein n=1 Tax=Neorhodopirellula pilleata TaxID=2714738 RepID=A0A5C5ZZS7_9BACT|nr:hypothetical protein Pla100_43890 [Neorhodopirellula pilleata]
MPTLAQGENGQPKRQTGNQLHSSDWFNSGNEDLHFVERRWSRLRKRPVNESAKLLMLLGERENYSLGSAGVKSSPEEIFKVL